MNDMTSALGDALATWASGRHISREIRNSLLESGYSADDIAMMELHHFKPAHLHLSRTSQTGENQ
ncbi:hypothetical protein [Thiorhodococcus fuscus]|uniref:Uncharacterized protein n=1 Tax=Thiorhodococcus fuscus TaxID=527200 RepID=A0ABW4Y4R8_9GAMM